MTENLPRTEEENALRWNTLFRVLSLDIARPYWRAMNVELCEEQQSRVQEVAKEACKRARSVPQELNKGREFIGGTRIIVDFFFSKLAEEIDDTTNVEVRAWASEDFVGTPTDKAVESTWMFGLLDLRNEYPKVDLNLDPAQYQELVDRVESEIVEHIHSRKRIHETVILQTDWDKELFREYLASLEGSQGTFLDTKSGMALNKFYAITCVEMTMEKNFMRIFWSDILVELDQHEIESLFNWYKLQFAEQIDAYPYLHSMPRPPRIHSVK